MVPCVPAHHWLIDARPTRGSYRATCKNCGAETEFPESAIHFKFRMNKHEIPAPIVERLLGLPAGSGTPIPSG